MLANIKTLHTQIIKTFQKPGRGVGGISWTHWRGNWNIPFGQWGVPSKLSWRWVDRLTSKRGREKSSVQNHDALLKTKQSLVQFNWKRKRRTLSIKIRQVQWEVLGLPPSLFFVHSKSKFIPPLVHLPNNLRIMKSHFYHGDENRFYETNTF